MSPQSIKIGLSTESPTPKSRRNVSGGVIMFNDEYALPWVAYGTSDGEEFAILV
jgi:hypothetical protein